VGVADADLFRAAAEHLADARLRHRTLMPSHRLMSSLQAWRTWTRRLSVPSEARALAEWHGTTTSAAAYDVEHVEVEVHIVHAQARDLGHLPPVSRSVRMIAGIASSGEALAGTCVEERAELVVGQYGDGLLRRLRRGASWPSG
jgi:hypothetical protein